MSWNDSLAIRCRIIWRSALTIAAALLGMMPLVSIAIAAEYRVAMFSMDITIPLGHRCMGVLPTKSKSVADPLQMHGFVLLGPDQPIVLAAFDWCEIRNDSYDQWREVLAESAGTVPERVLVCSVHQHDAPVVDRGAQALLTEVGLAGELFDIEFENECHRRAAQAVRDSLATAIPVTHIGLGEAPVDRIASNRRVVHLDGRIDFDRYSSGGGDPFQADFPTGLIDSMLKTISFWNEDQPVVAVSHYAVHPMSYYGRGEVSYDFVGMAREMRRRASGVPQIYVTGCSGDITAGKYNDGSTERRGVLADRLRRAMEDAWNHTQRSPIQKVDFRSVKLILPFHEGDSFTEEALAAQLRNEEATVENRILAAMGLNSRRRLAAGHSIGMPCIDFGNAQIVVLPGEAFVGYQVIAQQMRPDAMVMAIGFGECWPGYIPTQSAFEDHFGHGWRWAGPGSESAMRAAMRAVLQPTSTEIEQSGKWRQIDLPGTIRERCIQRLQDGILAPEFWPSIHAAEGLILGGCSNDVITLISKKLQFETDARHRCGLLRELVRAGERHRASEILDILASSDPYGHVHAAESLYKVAEIGDGQALRSAMAGQADPRLTLMAAAALTRCGNRQALSIVRDALDSNDDTLVGTAAWILGGVGDTSDISRLRIHLPNVKGPQTRANLCHAMALLGDAESLAELAKQLDSENPAIRASAAVAAGDARATSVAQKLISLLDDSDLDTRIRAAQALLVLDQPPPTGRDEQVSFLVFEVTARNPRYTEGSIIELADGTLLFAITEFQESGSDFAKARIIARTSSDGGRTWSPPRILQENVGTWNVMSVTLRRLGPAGNWKSPIGMFYLVKDDYDSLHAFLRISCDGAKTFGEPIKITGQPGYHVMNNDRVTRLANGRLLAPIAFTENVQKVNHFVSYCSISDDNGLTWRPGKGHVDQPRRGAMEPEVIETRDGRVMMIVRTQMGSIAACYSEDGGDTWGEPFMLDVKAPESPATLRRIPATGDLLLVWNNTYIEGADHGGQRTPLAAAISSDEGKTWHHVKNLETCPDRTYAYTSLTFAGPRAIMSYWEQDPKTGWLSTRFRSVPVCWFYE